MTEQQQATATHSTTSNQGGPSQQGAGAAKKGWTKDGKSRQRAYRTYYGVSAAGVLSKYPSYEAREAAVKKSGVQRVSARDAERIEREGAPVVGAKPKHIVERRSAPTVPAVAAAIEAISKSDVDRQVALLQAQALLNHCVTLIGEIQSALADAQPGRK